MSGVALTSAQALELCRKALRHVGYSDDESVIISASIIDAEMCGYPALGMARLLTIAEDPRTLLPRTPVRITHETPLSALMDGGNYAGPYALHCAAKVAVDKARASGIALVGLHNSYLSGRSAYYVEEIARAGFVGIHVASSAPFVVAPGGNIPVLGTNPLAIAIPSTPDPFLFDMGTSVITHGEVVLADRLGLPLPPAAAVDKAGNETRDAAAALGGGILPLAGHKGFGLSLMIQALGLIAGAALPAAHVPGHGFMFIVFAPGLLLPEDRFQQDLHELLAQVRASSQQPGGGPVRIPSERAFHSRSVALTRGFELDAAVHARIVALCERDELRPRAAMGF